MSFEDTFQALSISSSGAGTRWSAHTPWHGDFGDALFDNPGPQGPFIRSDDGLKIIARKDAAGRWHSGLICSVNKDGPGKTGFTQKYGYFEIRTKLPSGPGVWPAFWLIGDDKTTFAAEIDILEYFGAFPSYFHNWMHIFKNGKDVLSSDHLVKVSDGSLVSDYHRYGVMIDPDVTTFYLDQHEIWTVPTREEFKQPMYILVDFAIGGGWPSDSLSSPAVMGISYVRVFQRKNSHTAGQ